MMHELDRMLALFALLSCILMSIFISAASINHLRSGSKSDSACRGQHTAVAQPAMCCNTPQATVLCSPQQPCRLACCWVPVHTIRAAASTAPKAAAAVSRVHEPCLLQCCRVDEGHVVVHTGEEHRMAACGLVCSSMRITAAAMAVNVSRWCLIDRGICVSSSSSQSATSDL